MASRFDGLITLILTASVVVIAGVLVRRELTPASAASAREPTAEYVANWETRVRAASVKLTQGKVEVIVFTDFECPFCARMDSALRDFENAAPGSIAKSLVHFPLPHHRFAYPAARAFECATKQDRAAQMNETLYQEQSHFGLSPWTVIAMRAGVSDTAEFEKCRVQTEKVARVQAGLDVGEKLNLTSTPTVLVNGWLIDPPLPRAVLDAVSAAMRGDRPGGVLNRQKP